MGNTRFHYHFYEHLPRIQAQKQLIMHRLFRFFIPLRLDNGNFFI